MQKIDGLYVVIQRDEREELCHKTVTVYKLERINGVGPSTIKTGQLPETAEVGNVFNVQSKPDDTLIYRDV